MPGKILVDGRDSGKKQKNAVGGNTNIPLTAE
jgi:hypothetical protein